ncbi:Late embryogenesis abundant protein [Cinnamomum micranthum f. kanehirae]|uniref:Late embryogenesis abundant protein n=1 Tax=Cinnamomum micranthum f. kanehirae TaxID=337451 RepID=A0A443PRR7_9MAGN|nr:Late embryogenesis abundant protein [Cinnamomum micranthum f. kanehirae]
MSLCGGCCRWCTGFIFTLGLTALFMWLSFRPSKPKFSISEFHIPALNKTSIPNLTSQIPPTNTSIFFNLKLENPNKDKGIYYDALNLTFYYGLNHSRIGNASIPAFYQGYKKTAHKQDKLSTEERAFWENATRVVSEGGKAAFQVRMETSVRYKIVGFKTVRHHLNLTDDVKVNDHGTSHGAKLHSPWVTRCGGYCAPWVMVWMFLVLVLS